MKIKLWSWKSFFIGALVNTIYMIFMLIISITSGWQDNFVFVLLVLFIALGGLFMSWVAYGDYIRKIYKRMKHG